MNKSAIATAIVLISTLNSCKLPVLTSMPADQPMPKNFVVDGARQSSIETKIQWRNYFQDIALIDLIDTALAHNQELNIATQEIIIAQNEAKARSGEYLPFVNIGATAGAEKSGRYTVRGTTESHLEIEPERENPDPVPDFKVGVFASWELDIWHKFRNNQKAAATRYLASQEARNFLQTNLIAEIATTYYELIALDNELEIIKQNIKIQSDAFEIVRIEKEASKVTELAVKRFEAQLLNTKSRQFYIEQKVTEAENKLRFLVGSYPTSIKRNTNTFNEFKPDQLITGNPVELLANRPDIKAAELNLAAAKLDVVSARANFYPSLRLISGLGFNAYNPALLVQTPQSLIYGIVGDLVGPLVNRNAIKAQYQAASARQIQAIYSYQQTVLKAYLEVNNQLAMVTNMAKSYQLKSEEVDALNRSVVISGNLFRSARADYMEVLLTQRDAQESKFELVETKFKQLQAWVQTYRALGGGWR